MNRASKMQPVRAVSLLFLIGAPTLWGGNFVVGRIASATIDAVWLNLLRWLLAFVVLVPIAWPAVRREWALVQASFGRLFILAVIGVVGFNTVLYHTLETVPASEAAVGFALTPILIAILAAIADRRPVRASIICAALISVVGVWVMQDASPTVSFLRGSLSVLPASLIWALYCVLLSKFAVPASPMTSFVMQIGIGLLVQVPLAMALAPIPRIGTFTQADIVAIGYLGIGAAAIAFLIWQKAIRECGADFAGPFMNIVPLSSVILAGLFLGETLSRAQIWGAFLISVALAVSYFGGVRRVAS